MPLSEIPNFYRADYLNPGDCIIQGYRTRRVPINRVLDLIEEHGEYEMDAYHFGYSSNGRYIGYSHIVRIDQERMGGTRFQFAGQGAPLPGIPFEKLYDALWWGSFDEQLNVKMMDDIHLETNQILSHGDMKMDAVEVDQFGHVLKRFDLKKKELEGFDPFESERGFISWIELPIFSVYITELPPE